MNEAINKAIVKSSLDGKTRYVFATYAKIVTLFEPAPFGKHCWQVKPDGQVIEIKEKTYV